MSRSRMLPVAAGLSAGSGAVLLGQLAWAITRPLPSFDNLDASGSEGEPDGVPLTMAVLGDSSCTGPGLDDPGEIWTRVLARSIGSRYRVDVRSFAVGGAKASDVLRDQLPHAVALAPDLALISVGGNDALRAVPLRRFRRELATITREMVGAAGLVGLSGVGDLGSIPRLPRPLADVARARAMAMNRVHHEVGTRLGAVVADQWEWSAPLFRDNPAMFAPDHFHASAAGHAVWAEVARQVIEPHLDSLRNDQPPPADSSVASPRRRPADL